LLATIRNRGYEFIVLHTPPVLSAGDASWLAPFVDGVILTATWGKTRETHLADAASQLRMNRAVLIGTVIDQVNVGKHVSRGYGGFVMPAELTTPASSFGQARVNGKIPRPDPPPGDSPRIGLNLRP
jgi:Mrp family chromosome partitioning ATPase